MAAFTHPWSRLAVQTFIGLCLGVLLVGIIVTTIRSSAILDAVRETQLGNKTTLTSTERAATAAEASLDRVEDCTTPGRDCYIEGQARTAEAVVGITEGTLRVIVAALSCQEDGIVGQRALSRCTVRRAQATSDQP